MVPGGEVSGVRCAPFAEREEETINHIRRRSHDLSRPLVAALVAASALVLLPAPALAATGNVRFAQPTSITANESSSHPVVIELTGLTGPLVEAVTVTISDAGTGSATPGNGVTDDYALPSPSQVTFPSGSNNGATQTLFITIHDDDIDDDGEDIDLVIGAIVDGPSDTVTASPAANTHQVTITDNDTAGVFVPNDTVAVIESIGDDTYSVTLTSRPTASVIIEPSATQVQFNPLTHTFQPNNWDTTKVFTVTAIDDSVVEGPHGDTITHTVASGDPVYDGLDIIPDANVTVTITDDDDVVVSIGPAAPMVPETDGPTTAQFTVSVTPQKPFPVNFEFSTAEGGGNPATIVSDFQQRTNVAGTVAASTPSVLINVGIVGDDLDDDAETFVVSLANPSHGTISGAQGSVIATIVDDDASPQAVDDTYLFLRTNTDPVPIPVGSGVILGTGTDIDGDNALTDLVATLVNPPSFHVGVFTLEPDGSFVYDHDGSLATVDSFTYFLADPAGNTSNTATVTLNIANDNDAPEILAGPDQSGPEGSEISISASFTDLDVDQNHVASIDWGDGGGVTPGTVDQVLHEITASHIYTDNGEFTVAITVSDGLDEATDALTVVVDNVRPTLTLEGASFTTDEGSQLEFTTTPVDPGNDELSYTWDVLRNGVVWTTKNDSGPSSSFSFAPDDDAVDGVDITWRVRVRVEDDDGGFRRVGRIINVDNVNPAVTLKADGVDVSGSPNLGSEGTTVTFSTNIEDPSVDTFTHSWEVRRQGVVIATGSDATLDFTPGDNGTYVVIVDVDDDDNVGDPTTGTAVLFPAFDNAPPKIVELRGNLSPRVNRSTFLRAFIDDPGADDSHTLSVTWGDGAITGISTPSPIQLQHTYTTPGVVDADVCVSDDVDTVCQIVTFNVGGTLSIGSDFNGDGFEDVAIGVPNESNGGGVAVFMSNANGPSRTNNELLIQGVDGIPDADEFGDGFGSDVAFGDFDDDGFDDLVISHPGETVAGAQRAGAFTVVPGSSAGLDTAAATTFHQNSAGVPGTVGANDRFGHTLVVGDFNGDAFADLAVGVPGQRVGASLTGAGVVTIFDGSPTGISGIGSREIHLNTVGVAGAAGNGDRLGSSLAAGDFNRDGEYDLVMGAPNKTLNGKAKAGAVVIIKGSVLGLTGIGSQIWSQKNSALGDTPEKGDRFGFRMASADFDGDGHDDLAVSAPEERVDGVAKAGAVWMVRGSGKLLTTKGVEMFTLDTPGVAGTMDTKDRFGRALAAGDVDKDGFAELAVGVPFEDIGGKNNAGVFVLLDGTATGLSGVGSERWHEDVAGIGGIAAGGDRFAASLAMIDTNGDGRYDVLVGIPFQNTAGAAESGAALLIRGSTSGLTTNKDRVLHQNVTGVLDQPEPGDWFGLGL